MLKDFDIENFGPIKNIAVKNLQNINLILGKNGSGKTFLLKILYSTIKSQEEFGRGDDKRDFAEVLADKLYWTFQAEKLGDLVARGVGNRLKVSVSMSDNTFLAYEFGQDTTKKIAPIHNNLPKRSYNSIFLPPKEVLTLEKVILKSALQDKAFGFDATYADLALALRNPTMRGRNYDAFMKSRQLLEKMFEGRVEFDSGSDKWIYKQGTSKFSIMTTAEGVKKIAILDTLLGNRYLTPESVIFIDEPESALHPSAIVKLMDILELLAKSGIQIFIASHSYYVVKKLFLIAQKEKISIPVLSEQQDKVWDFQDLKEGMPDTEIVNESIRLYEEELEVSLK
ncbi:MAG: ATP-binding protein [Methylophilaceae bacterium]|nr:ATP-binding protein [Methylophilaceae bacterium]